MKLGAFFLPRFARAAFVIGGALPWLVAPLRASLLSPRSGALLDLLFLPMCHRLPERTLLLDGVAMPLCSRCAGLFAGVALGALACWPALSLARWRLIMALTFALMIAEIAAQDLHLHPIWHATRLLSGALFGYALGAATIGALYRNAREDAGLAER
jgi:hypothetical protein